MKGTIASSPRLVRRHAVACVALLMVLGVTGYAAAGQLTSRNGVGSAQVIDGSLQKRDLGKKAWSALKGARGLQGLRGPAGPAGLAGAQGPKGAGGVTGAVGQPGAQGARGVAGPAMLRTTPRAAAVATLDSGGNVGNSDAVTIGSDGLGLISYVDGTNGKLKVAHCNDGVCGSATASALDSGVGSGIADYGTSIAVGADGLGLVTYFDAVNDALKLAHCSNVACTSATRSTLDTGPAGVSSSVTVGADGLALISYRDPSFGVLKVAHCDNLVCTSATKTALDNALNDGDTSVAIGADGLGLVSYYDWTNGDLRVAHCDNTACTTSTKNTIDSAGDVGYYNALAIGADGLGLIAYNDHSGGLKVAHCNDAACSGAFIATLATGAIGTGTSVTVGADGLGVIGYYDASSGNGDLKVAHCNTTLCSAASLSSVDTGPDDLGRYSSATLGTDGLVLISYYDGTNDNLKVAHCSNAFCVPYLRRR
jgi:hypothetical protein